MLQQGSAYHYWHLHSPSRKGIKKSFKGHKCDHRNRKPYCTFNGANEISVVFHRNHRVSELSTKLCQPMLTNQTISSSASSSLLLENHSNIRSHSDDCLRRFCVLDPCEDFVYRQLFFFFTVSEQWGWCQLLVNQDQYFLLPMKEKLFILRTYR